MFVSRLSIVYCFLWAIETFQSSERSCLPLQFKVSTLDIGVPEEAEQLIKMAEAVAPVGGIFHLAMYLADKLITNQVSSSKILSNHTQLSQHVSAVHHVVRQAELRCGLTFLQTGESWNKVMHAKAKGAANLDKVSRKCKELEHFVMWSSFVASAGNEGVFP